MSTEKSCELTVGEEIGTVPDDGELVRDEGIKIKILRIEGVRHAVATILALHLFWRELSGKPCDNPTQKFPTVGDEVELELRDGRWHFAGNLSSLWFSAGSDDDGTKNLRHYR